MPAFRYRSDVSEEGPSSPLDYALMIDEDEIPKMVAAALQQDRARLAFLPVYAAEGQRRIAFQEGLIRLLDNNGRLIPAGKFMERIETTGLGRDIDAAALRLGLVQLRQDPELKLAINMSARSIADAGFRRTLEEGLHRTPRIGARLILEISEGSAMLMPEVVTRFMAEYRPHGITFALDDFGAGLTAFRHLRDFLFDMVKIDPVFVRGIDASPDNQVLTEALVTVAHQFGMFAVAEGVETESEAHKLRAMGVECLQGYLFGEPSAQPKSMRGL